MYQVMLTEKGKLELDKWDALIKQGNEDFTQEEDFQIITPLAIVAGRMSADFLTITTESKSISEMISKLNEQMEYKCGYACDGSRLNSDWFTFKLQDDYRYSHLMKSTIGADLLYTILFENLEFKEVKELLIKTYSKENNDVIKEIITQKIENAETPYELFSIKTNMVLIK
ncbi:hypothetical protein [Paenibacillus sp. LK1]|uniref:hypothetical protein n=1 Tax=Paenibacillus sp. LK1 TaxID=2053014 RepID=UPI000C1A620D|nr:hypothetical protein [Paenibacillus sp. LK1]PIH61531.1 hypothetical protein CS562_03745 [Paenibacillus sp. LK1]